HARAVEPVEDAGDDLVPQRPADPLVDGLLTQVPCGGLVGGPDGVGPRLPAVVLQAPAKALHGDGRHDHLDALVGRGRQPGLDAAHAEADHADPAGIDVVARPQVIDRLPQVPAGAVVERVLLPLARLRIPGPDDGRVVGLGPLLPPGALAVVAG